MTHSALTIKQSLDGSKLGQQAELKTAGDLVRLVPLRVIVPGSQLAARCHY